MGDNRRMDYLLIESQEAVHEIGRKYSHFTKIQADFDYEPTESDLIDIQQIIKSADRIAKRLEKACIAARLNKAQAELKEALTAWETSNA